MAAVLVLEPIFEADLQPEQYAYRPDRSALDAVRHVHKLINTGHGEIVDADLSGYFDSIPHAELMKSVARRVVDGAMLHLIKMWLEAPVEETDERGKQASDDPQSGRRPGHSARGSDQSRCSAICTCVGSCWGGRSWGTRSVWRAHIVNYADDFVICCRGSAEEAMATMRDMMSKLKLTVNETKTRVCRAAGREVRFSGVHVRAVLLADRRGGPIWAPSVQEAGAAHL